MKDDGAFFPVLIHGNENGGSFGMYLACQHMFYRNINGNTGGAGGSLFHIKIQDGTGHSGFLDGNIIKGN